MVISRITIAMNTSRDSFPMFKELQGFREAQELQELQELQVPQLQTLVF